MKADTNYLVRRIRTEDGDMFGVFKQNEKEPIYRTFLLNNAKLIIETLTMIDLLIMDKDNGIEIIMRTLRNDRRQHDGKSTNRHR